MFADLIARLEAAVEPSRDLDVAIWAAIGYPGVVGTKPTAYRLGTAEKLNGEVALTWPGNPRCGHHDLGQVRRYTASLDAALTLVPEGADVEVYFSPREKPHRRGCVVLTISRQVYEAHAATLALALCIAALRARAADGGPR
jgi:hypothetical protein